MLIAEMFAWYKSRGLTLFDALIGIYEKYGYAKEALIPLPLKEKKE